MPDSPLPIVEQFLSTCTAGAAEAAETIGRTVEKPLALAVGQPRPAELPGLPKELTGPGLMLAWTAGDTGVLLTLPEATGLVPTWVRQPDATGRSKLATLAQELGVILFPPALTTEDGQAGWVPDLAEAVFRGTPVEGAVLIPLEMEREGKPCGSGWMVLPVSAAAKSLAMPEAPSEKPGRGDGEASGFQSVAAAPAACADGSPSPVAPLHPQPAADQGSGGGHSGRKTAALETDRGA